MTSASDIPRDGGHRADTNVAAIFVAGFMGSGKSTVGRALAARLGWRFADLDDEIERGAGQGIPGIFETLGEAGFRDCEHEALREQAGLAAAGTPLVLALGAEPTPFPGIDG